MNKLHHSTYTHTPSGSVCPFCTIFLKPMKRGYCETKLFCNTLLFLLEKRCLMRYVRFYKVPTFSLLFA